MKHGTNTGYFAQGCRCDECRAAARAYRRQSGRASIAETSQREALRDLLHELFPFGLTDDCPARQGRVAA